jgi:hypothetical protein
MPKYIFLLMLLICAAVIVLPFPSLPLRKQGQGSSINKHKPKYEDERWPLVDYNAPEPADPQERAKRKAKDKRYNNLKLVGKPTPNTESGEANLITDWEVGFPALPVEQSAVILIAKVVSAEAHLSEDKSGIYSEFGLTAEKVLKNESSTQISSGNSITVERIGGRVLTPTGHIHQYGIAKQGMPKVGSRYLLFLEKKDEQSLYILTGYELRESHVFPLDGEDSANVNKVPQFAEYVGTDEASFLNRIEKLLTTPS